MFFIFNKQKMYSYVVAMTTVVILFIVSAFLNQKDVNTIETTSNVISENNVIEE